MPQLIQYKAPWRQHPLDEWIIIRMYQYKNAGAWWMYVEMMKGEKKITTRGPDTNQIWVDLYTMAVDEIS